MSDKIYLVIDLKSFFASVEAVDRNLDPMTTNLVVADPARERGTVCLAITPAMKKLGVRNRCRVFEIPPDIDYIMAPPRMARYIEVSCNIYSVYLKYISAEDMHVYSIDEVFLDVTDYLSLYKMGAKELAETIMQDVFDTTGIRATCGIGTNMYLAKIALDITAKHAPDFIGILDEDSYCKTLWHHKPITDFWRIGPGTARRLASIGLLDMYDVAHAPEKLLYNTLGSEAEFLIDHAWGKEPTTIWDIKNYRQKSHSLSTSQVLMRDYNYDEALIIVKEMVDLLCLDLVDKGLVTDNVSLWVKYTKETIPPSHSSVSMTVTTNSVRVITDYFVKLYEKIANRLVPIRKISISFNHVMDETFEQYDLFTDPEVMAKDRSIQRSVNEIKDKFGKNAILKGMNLQEAATTKERNGQIGGHKSGEI